MMNVFEIARAHLFSTASVFSLADSEKEVGDRGRTDGQERPNLLRILFLKLPYRNITRVSGGVFVKLCKVTFTLKDT